MADDLINGVRQLSEKRKGRKNICYLDRCRQRLENCQTLKSTSHTFSSCNEAQKCQITE